MTDASGTSITPPSCVYPIQRHQRGELVDKLKQRTERLRICRGCPQRDVQRCQRSGRECYEHADNGFCPAGLFSVEPGTWPSGYHNEALYRETLAAAPPAPDPFAGQPVVHLGCHLWPVIHPDEPQRPWFGQILLWHELARQINGRCIVGVATGPNTATFEEIQSAFDLDRFKLFELPNDEIEGENPTFRRLLEMLPSGPNDVLIYCHSKGVQAARRNSEAVQLWRELMYETVPFNWRRAVEKLAEGYKAFGAFRAFTTSRNVIPQGWYYSGTFFIGRLKWFYERETVFSFNSPNPGDCTLEKFVLRPLAVAPIWGGVEHFLGTHFPASDCWCEFADGRDLEQEYHISRMFPEIVHDGFRWEMERLEREVGCHIEQHKRELEFLDDKIRSGDRVLVIGSRAGGVETALKAFNLNVTTVSIDPEPLSSNPHTLIIGSSHDNEVQLQARNLGPYDVVFIDGDHTLEGVTQDWEFAQKLNPRLVAFHDIADTTFHRSLNCNVAPLWREIQSRYITSEKIVGGGWGGIGVVELRETREQDADLRPEVDVSIIITVGPGYEAYAQKAIKSAFQQGGDGIRYEVIVVWDGTQEPDDVPMPAYRSLCVDFRNVQQARRFGVDKARGRYTLFLDADDWLPDGFAEAAFKQLQHAETVDHRVAGVYPSAEYVDLKTGLVESRVPARPWDRTLFDSANFMVISTLCRTEDLRNARWGSSDMRTLEDHEMWLSVVERGVHFVPGINLTLSVGLHDDSLSRKVVHKEYADRHAISEKPITMIVIDTGSNGRGSEWTQERPENVEYVRVLTTNADYWDALNREIQNTRTPFVWIIDEHEFPQMPARDALRELAAGFEADVAAVCGLTGSRACSFGFQIETLERFLTINGSGFSCVLARTRVLQEAGPIYAPTPWQPWPDRLFWYRVYQSHHRVRVANRVPCAHVDRQLEILTYHEVSPDNPSKWSITPELFRAHLTWLRDNGWRFTTLDDAVLNYGPAGKFVVITFDDGRLGQWDHAKPILDEFGIKATFYICPEMTNGEAAEDQRYTEFMRWDHVFDLVGDGHTIGNHSATHTRLDNLHETAIARQIGNGKTLVETSSVISHCDHFAPPYGSTSADVVRVAKEIGHRTVATTEERGNPLPLDPYNLGRRQITSGTTVEQLAAMLGGAKPEFSFIIATHNEDPAILAATVQGLRQLGPPEVVEIIVVDDASDGPVLISDMKGTTHLRIFSGAVRRGIAKARNVGVEMSHGRTLIFTDAHVAFSPNILDVLRSSGVAEGDGIRGCETAILHHPDDLKFAASGGVPFSTCFLAEYLAWKLDLTGFPKVVPISAGSPVDDTWENVPYVGGCCLAISRKLFDDLGGFAECLVGIGNGGDLELAIRCHAVGLPVRSTRAATCYHLTENRKHEIDYSDPLSAYDLDRYPGSTTNILRTVCRYIDATHTLRMCRKRGINPVQIVWLLGGDDHAFSDRMQSVRRRYLARGGTKGEIVKIMTSGEPL